MNVQVACSPKYPVNPWALRMQDMLMVSAFGIWSAALGLAPILVFHVLAN